MPADDVKRLEKVREWVKYADEDLRLAHYALTMRSSCPSRLIAYHAQQCAEKYLKAYLVYHQVNFPFSHNIGKLLQFCAQLASWPTKLRNADALTAYAVTLRYPGQSDTVSKRQALRCVRLAKNVQDAVRAALTTEGLKLGQMRN